MNPFLIYFLKVNIGIVIFYGFYRLFFNRDTLFKMRRSALIAFYLIAFSYPLLNIQNWISEKADMTEVVESYSVIMNDFYISAPADTSFTLTDYLYIAYAIGAFLLLLRLVIDLISILTIRIKSKKISLNQTDCYILKGDCAPFSFFKWIFINPEKHNSEELDEILTHEITHANQYHSFDTILSELVCILLWFNPFVWLLNREIRQNLEYLADDSVLEVGHDVRHYQYHLLALTYTKAAAKISNNFQVLPLKNRIRMMNKNRTSKKWGVKYAIFAPLTLSLLFVSNIELMARQATNLVSSFTETLIEKPTLLSEALVSEQTPQNEQTFTAVEKMPEFPGGVNELLKFIAKNVKYPEDAVKENKQGRVIVSFIIDKNGKVVDPEIKRGVSPSIDAEAIRVVKSMPNWTPGEQRGQKVRVKYTLPINFNLPKPAASTEATSVQANTSTDQKFVAVEKMPQFPGGETEMMKFIARTVKYPVVAQENGIQGRVIVTFTVDKTGKIVDPIIRKGVDPSLDQEAIRVVNAMPQWIPGEQRGQKVNVVYTVPITFRLQGPENEEQNSQVKAGKDDIVVVGFGAPKSTVLNLRHDTENPPLVIVDGKEIPQADMKDINPDTIDNISVLKGEAAKEKYGDKAKNGVVIIQLKK
ncbi:MAG: TonB family protein [Bacteroidales bacterium]